ncbi:DUF6498-containing protein [Natronolimnohabitans sp. A-GB9]|uniref:DUF6498-containing protein n=1 Tax=Natronolimnohabitans sp. A-GB9 TaxID=3069757 RepID=UPI0027B0490C|nr:DUF6498-containing protein [Natronolimnohabitans sp. A-GB9]MDQ2052197.1 DUF6498-containing protein [Natronolimnohabitans sp. A-GB9]
MQRNQLLLLILLVANVSILAGIPAFGWSPISVAALFAIDAILAVTRTTIEKTFVGHPPDKTGLHAYSFPIGGHLINKRGCYRLPFVPVNIYPQNFPYVIRSLFIMAFLGIFTLGAYYSNGIPVGRPATGGFDSSLTVIILLLVAKHAAIVAWWASDGIYERASVGTIRPRERLLATVVGLFAFGFISITSSETVAVAVLIVLIPKLLFDLREAGIGPSHLTFNPNCERQVERILMPTTNPYAVFHTDRRSLTSATLILATPLFVLVFGPLVFSFLAGVTLSLIGLNNSSWGWIAVTATTIAVVYGGAVLVQWIKYGNVEYRVYDDTLIAYDTHLRAVQWRIPLEEISSTSAEHSFFTLITPFCNPNIHVEYRGDGPPANNYLQEMDLKRIPYLENPEKMSSVLTDHYFSQR